MKHLLLTALSLLLSDTASLPTTIIILCTRYLCTIK